jgi:uncharacterized membrane protein
MARRQLSSLISAALVVGAVGLALAASACAKITTIDEYDCAKTGTTLTYDNFGKGFLDRHCQSCHGAPANGRNGAPASFDFHTREDAFAHKDRIFARAAEDNATMPPGPDDPPPAERDQLAEWLACGAE